MKSYIKFHLLNVSLNTIEKIGVSDLDEYVAAVLVEFRLAVELDLAKEYRRKGLEALCLSSGSNKDIVKKIRAERASIYSMYSETASLGIRSPL